MKLIISHITATILLFVLTFSSHAQNWSYKELPNQSKLPVASIFSVLQDQDGFMWYATNGGGLCMDDGYNIYPFRNDRFASTPITNNDILCMREDTLSRRIYFGTHEGAYYVDQQDYRVYVVDSTLQHHRIDRITTDNKGNVLITEGRNLHEYTPTLLSTRTTSLDKVSGFITANDMLIDTQGTTWILLSNGKILYRKASEKTFKAKHTASFSEPTCIIESDEPGICWVGTRDSGLWSVSTFHQTCLAPTLQAYQIVYNRRDHILFTLSDHTATTGQPILKAYQAIKGDFSPIALPTDSLIRNGRLNSLYIDHRHSLWVAGQSPHTFILSRKIYNDGTYTFRPTVLRHIPIVRMALQGQYAWLWAWDLQLMLYDTTSGQHVRLQDSHPDAATWPALTPCNDGNGIWIASESGNWLLQITHEHMRTEVHNIVQLDSHINRIIDDGNGHLWIGTDTSVFRYDLTKRILQRMTNDTGVVTQLALSSDGSVYYTVESVGLGCVNSKGEHRWIRKGEPFTDVTVSHNGMVWSATKQGIVYQYNPNNGQFTEEALAGNRNGDIIYLLRADHKMGHIWILSDQYLKEYNPQNQSFRIIHSHDVSIQMDGLQSIYAADNGNIVLSGTGGYSIISPSVQLDEAPAALHTLAVSRYEIDGHVSLMPANTESITLKANVTDLRIHLTTCDIINAGNIRFAYRLHGWDKEWNYLPEGDNIVHYVNLSKGEYELEVRATDETGSWSSPVKLLTVHRLPAWYETWWAYLLYLLAFVIAIFYVLQYYFKRKHNKDVFLKTEEVPTQFITSSKGEEEFLNKATELVQKNLNDTTYGVPEFSSDMCMSRMSLYRKLQAMTGQSPSEFIRTIRLKEAAKLLREKTHTVSEIADLCGFSSANYFGKSFKGVFGVTPSQYQSGDTFTT